MIKKTGFTLSEVLIVLVITGIIAVLSIQTVITQKTNYAFSNYYLYRDLKIAIGHMASSSHSGNLNSFSCDKARDITDAAAAETAYKACLAAGKTGSTHTYLLNYKSNEGFCLGLSRYLGTASPVNTSSFNNASLSDVYGNMSNINFKLLNKSFVYISEKSNTGDGKNYRIITIDSNGKSGPNKNGEDIISFVVYDNGEVLPVGEPAENYKKFMTIVKMTDISFKETLSSETEINKFIEYLKYHPAIILKKDKKPLSFKDGYCRAYGSSTNDSNYCNSLPDFPNFGEEFNLNGTKIPVKTCFDKTVKPNMNISCEFNAVKPKTPDFIPTPSDSYTSRGAENYAENNAYEINKY